ncbi:Hypothetical predicted protein [Mytilus galloprovincialis]|uniref:Uncharacterized protein n=1 Tax=Mytilus galloprovincialis TaxID=29158 RepID=A0A8B6GEQ0_MYTGA|nr:Hypothetical predicted protein [Mytilus galloprovincialis]
MVIYPAFLKVFAETIENGTEVYQTVFIPAGETNTPLVSSVSSVPLVFAVIGWTLAVVLAGTTVFYKRQLHSQQSNTPVTSNANIIELSGAYDRSDYINADATKDTDGHYESIK